jgi:hypothetical protein
MLWDFKIKIFVNLGSSFHFSGYCEIGSSNVCQQPFPVFKESVLQRAS